MFLHFSSLRFLHECEVCRAITVHSIPGEEYKLVSNSRVPVWFILNGQKNTPYATLGIIQFVHQIGSTN